MRSVPASSYAPHPARVTVASSRPHWWLAAMLLALHAGTAWDIEQTWARGFMLAHFGLFLLWQPLWRGERTISARHAAVIVVAGAGLAAFAGWWILAFWLAMMFGLLGGRATGNPERGSRMVLVIAAAYVLTLLLGWVVPHLFSEWQPEELLVPAVRYVLPLLPLAIFFVPVGESETRHTTVAIDLFYAALLFLLVVVLVLGSFVLRDVAQARYGYVLMQMLFGLALLLGALSFLWNPHGGYAGLQQLLSRYVAGMGLPFERWIAHLARLAEEVADADGFADQALEALVRTTRIEGVSWQHGAVEVTRGSRGKHSLRFDIRGQGYVLYLRSAPAPAMSLHLKLLAEVLAYFYEAKGREERERDDAYQRAIYETGARLTHDVKNLLQALRALCAAADESGPADDAALLALLKRQLPAVTGRVTATLDRLRAPGSGPASMVYALRWWEALQQRYEARGVEFSSAGIDDDLEIPAELFDGVAENLLDNALRKREPAPAVRVTFDASTTVRLEVADDGDAIPPVIARHLLQRRVSSRGGLGVGLYHCAMHAARLGYRLALVCNEEGEVRFALWRV
jgi:signal transduction histidine kinase